MSIAQSPAADAERQRAQLALRDRSRAARAAMSDRDRDRASMKIADRVVRAHWFRRARNVACYLPMHDEVDTWFVIKRAWQMKKRIFVPIVERKYTMKFRELVPQSMLAPNRFGILEPLAGTTIAPHALHVVLTPVVAFDGGNRRIGMGGGYYDRTFAFLRNRRQLLRPKLVGLAFACQRVEKIAANPWDIRTFCIVHDAD